MRTPASRLRAAALAAVPVALALYGWHEWRAPPAVDEAALERLLEDASRHPPDASGRFYAQLERQLARTPSDPRALVLMARLDMEAQRYEKAAAGYGKALAVISRVTTDPDVWAEYAEALGMAQGRTLVGEPLRLLEKALSLNPHHPQALDMAGSAAWEMQNFAQAAAYWNRLLPQFPAGSPRHGELAAAIERAQQRARTSLPPAR